MKIDQIDSEMTNIIRIIEVILTFDLTSKNKITIRQIELTYLKRINEELLIGTFNVLIVPDMDTCLMIVILDKRQKS